MKFRNYLLLDEESDKVLFNNPYLYIAQCFPCYHFIHKVIEKFASKEDMILEGFQRKKTEKRPISLHRPLEKEFSGGLVKRLTITKMNSNTKLTLSSKK